MAIIPDRATARRIGLDACCADGPNAKFTVFQYEHRPSRLTLYGVEITLSNGDKVEVRER